MLRGADVIVALSFSKKEIDPGEISHLQNLQFIQLVYAGADNLPFNLISEDIIMASNVGAFAEPIAEHVLALVLALAKSIMLNNRMLAEGQFAILIGNWGGAEELPWLQSIDQGIHSP